MAQTKELKQKLQSIQSIRRVTKTMEMLARSRMQAKVHSVKKSKPFAADALYMLGRLTHQQDIQHPFIQGKNKRDGKELLIAIGGDRGLAGAYHSRLDALLDMYTADDCDAISIGKKMKQALQRHGIPIADARPHPTRLYRDARELSTYCIQQFLDGPYTRIHILFNQFEHMFAYHTRELQVLPIDQASYASVIGENSFNNHEEVYTIEPGEQAVITTIVPQLLTALFEHIFKEAQAAEESSRMIAMKNATDNADRISEEVRRAYNSARQQSITTEIAEIINGSQQ